MPFTYVNKLEKVEGKPGYRWIGMKKTEAGMCLRYCKDSAIRKRIYIAY